MLKKVFIVISAVIILIALSVGIFSVSLVAYAKKNINYELDRRMLLDAKNRNTTRFYVLDATGEEKEVWQLNQAYKSRWVALSDVSDNVISAFISSEDREFYNHKGVNFKRTLYALANYVLKFKSQFGASTVTQQLIKNLSGDNDTTVSRKISEILRALEIEKHFSKEEILELYLNIVPLSDNIYGVGEAARVYFNKKTSELNVTEAATLAGIINAPSRYNPYRHPEQCKAKRNNVLYAMLENGKITEEEYDSLKKRELEVLPRTEGEKRATPWFIETAIAEIGADIARKYNTSQQGAQIILGSGLKILLTMEEDVQDVLDSYFENVNNFPDTVSRGMNFSMAIYSSESGNLSAIVGAVGKKTADKISNYATANVTPASTLKPIALYAPLLDEGKINWSTVFDDTPLTVKESEVPIYYPKNSPNRYDGLITVKDALRFSKNTIAVKMYKMLGGDKVFNSLKNDYEISTLVESRRDKSGKILTDIDISPLALGQLTDGIPLNLLTHCYTVFSSDGVYKGGKSYFWVKNSEGESILESTPNTKLIMKPETARIMTQLMSKVVDEGTAHTITLGEIVDTAGKSGTSGGDLERLFIGFTPYYTAGIWCGYPTKKQPIGAVEKTHFAVWNEVMHRIHDECVKRNEDELVGFSIQNLVEVEYCRDSGELVAEGCELDPRQNRIAVGYFTKDNMPMDTCKRHKIYELDGECFSLLDYQREKFYGITVSDDKYLSVNYRDLPKLSEVGVNDKKNGFFEFLKRFF